MFTLPAIAVSRMPSENATGSRYAADARFFQQIHTPIATSSRKAIGVFTPSTTGK